MERHSFIKYFYHSMLITLLLLCSRNAFALASCAIASGYDQSNVIVKLPATLNIPRDIPFGETIWDSDWQESGVGTKVICKNGGWYDPVNQFTYDSGFIATLQKIQGLTDVYSTTNPSIGIYMVWDNGITEWDERTAVMRVPRDWSKKPLGEYYPKTRIRVKLIAIAKPQSGRVAFPAPTAGLVFEGKRTNLMSFSITDIEVKSVSCKVETPTVNVQLEDIIATQLTGIGSVAKPKSFSIGLTCDEGALISAKFNGGVSENTTPEQGVIALSQSADGKAEGVGIQILYRDTPVHLGSSTRLVSSAGYIDIPFIAQYYQTKDPIRPGPANATATIEITYQ